jgi:hypothetical protein
MPLRCRQRFFWNNKSPDFSGFFLPVACTQSLCKKQKKTVLSNLIGPVNASELMTVS